MVKVQEHTTTPLVQLYGLSKRFPGVLALDQVNLDLHRGTIHALLGENGAGKSTLINLLSGVLQPEGGEIHVHGRRVQLNGPRAAGELGIATVHQEMDLFADLTVAENVALQHGWPRRRGLIAWTALRNLNRQAAQDLGRDLDPDRLAGSLSAAERQLLGIAAALAQKTTVLILDEPTSSLSYSETQAVFGHLRRFRAAGGAILYVSHRLEEIFQLADVATVLRDGRRVWNGPLAETNPERLITWMVGREIPWEGGARAVAPASRGPVRLGCKNLTATDGSFSKVSLEVRAHEVLGLYGLIGAGRSEWAQAVFGLRSISSGQVLVDGQPWTPGNPGEAAAQGLAYLPEDRLRHGLFAGLSVRANAVLASLRQFAWGPFVSSKQETRHAQKTVEQLTVRLRSLSQLAGTLSGGNQQKIILGRWLARQARILILDEPTRGVDIGAKAEIHALLRRLATTGYAIILVSSDLPEVLAQSDRVGVFREGSMVATFDSRTATAEQVASMAIPVVAAQVQPAAKAARLFARGGGAISESWLRESGLLAAVVSIMAFLAWQTDTFWQQATLRDVGENASLFVLCGLGAALVILAGGIDISFGSIMALGGATAGYLMQEGWSPALAVSAGLGVSAAAGGLNAALALLGRVHPIVITLGTMNLYRGLTLLLIGGQDILDVPASFRAPLRASFIGIPVAIWLALAGVAVAWFLLGWTVAGRHCLALGSNPAAALRSGIQRSRVWLTVFTLQGCLAGLAGILALGLIGRMQSTDFSEKTLEAIGVAVVGGIAITGGRGSVWGIWPAALLFRVLEKGWVLLHISGYWQRTIVGTLLLLAILADRFWRVRRGQEN